MKLAAKTLSALAAAGLVMGAIAAVPAIAEEKKEKTIFDYIEADLKAIDKEITKIFTPAK
ncbi:MAG: hypothetical protein AB7E66_16720 [Parvibaculaceae bacterium]